MSISVWTVCKLLIPSLQHCFSDATHHDLIIVQAYIWWVYLNVKIIQVQANVYEIKCVKHRFTFFAMFLLLWNTPDQLPYPPCLHNFSASWEQGPMSKERSLRLFQSEWQMVVTPERLSGKRIPSTEHGQPTIIETFENLPPMTTRSIHYHRAGWSSRLSIRTDLPSHSNKAIKQLLEISPVTGRLK